MFNLAQRLNKPEVAIDEAIYQAARMHRGCLPGIIADVSTSPNVYGVTVSVDPAIVEYIIDTNGVSQPVALPRLPMVKLAVLSAGGFSITFPVTVGDECLLIFQDMCLDAAWQNSGTQNPQLDKRRHDLSDAICLPLRWTQPSLSALTNYSNESIQIVSLDGTTVIDIAEGQITITAGNQIQLIAPAISMGPASGSPGPLMTAVYFNWWLANMYPFLVSQGYLGTPPPATGNITTDVTGS